MNINKNPKVKSKIPNVIISVESRKGGVGKTTAALCLARLLISRGYSVLFLDLDFTGTNAADISNSPFWQNDVSVLKNGKAGNAKSKPCNLLQFFDQYYMSGKPIPKFTILSSGSKKSIKIDLNKINIIGSQIYRTEYKQTEKSKNTDPCIMHPSVLFDELHSYWLLDFVKHLIEDYVDVVRGENPQVAVVLDNSPGYVGIAPEIHNWLTDLGPKIGKLLFVSSLDIQDIHSCNYAVDAVHRLFTRKWNTTRQYRAALNSQSKTEKVEDVGFYFHLATSTHNVDTSSLAFYNGDNHELQGKIPEMLSINNPVEYLAIVFNRVPRAIKKGDIVFNLPYASDMDFSSIDRLLDIEDRNNRFKNRMVSYDEYIENQYFSPLTQRKNRDSRYRRHWQRLIKKIAHMEERLTMRLSDTENNAYESLNIYHPNLQRIRERLDNVNTILAEARTNMAEAGLSDLARLIHDEWLPGSIIPTFRIALSTLLRESKIPYYDISPFEREEVSNMIDASHYIEKNYKRIKSHVYGMTKKDVKVDNLSQDILIGSLSFLIASSHSLRIWHSSIEMELSELIAEVLTIELTHWSRDSEGSKRKKSLQEFLAQDSITFRELRTSRMISIRRFSMEGSDTFVEFYRSCTSAQARLIDFEADSLFLLKLISFMVERSIEMYNYDVNQFPYVRGIAEKVIVEKTMTHREALNKMSTALQTAEYFSEYETVLNNILKKWEIGI